MLDTGPATPRVGPSFSVAMEEMGFQAGQEQEFICHVLCNPTTYPIRKEKEAGFDYVRMIPGHLMDGPYGPRKAKVMVIGKMPGYEEAQNDRHFVGEAGQILRNTLNNLGAKFYDWYATNVSHFMPPVGKVLKKPTLDENAYYLHQEIKLVDPDFILALGAEAVKYLLPKRTLKNVRGAFMDYGRAKVFCTANPAAILYQADQRQAFEDDMEMFVAAVDGGISSQLIKTNYYYIDNQKQLDKAVDELIAMGYKQFAVDAEWSGRDYITGKLRTIQVAWAEGRAMVIKLLDENKNECFKPNRYAAVQALQRLFYREGVELYGHGFRADLPWLVEFGLSDLIHYFKFDTMLANHLLRDGSQALNVLALRFTDLGRYDLELEKWKEENGLGEDEGYGNIPDALLLLYGARDADATFRIAQAIIRELYKPENAQFLELYFETVHPATEGILEMEMSGLHADPERMKELVHTYEAKRDEILANIRQLIGKPKFNFRSYTKIQDYLYKDLAIRPIKCTQAFDYMDWDRFEVEHGGDLRYASTDKEVLGILATQHPEAPAIGMIRDVKFIDQITKNFLRPADEGVSLFEDGEEFSEGLLGMIHPDGRIRPNISQLAVTGRWRCYRPNLQNIPKRRERDYDRIFAPVKVPKIRTCFTCRPGYVLVEADYKQAEMFVLAWISGDANLLEALTTPGRDLHSETAVKAFKLDAFVGIRDGKFVDEVKERYPSLRVAAKTINFGIPYQRGAAAIAREILQEGIEITVAQAQAGIDGFYEMYPGVRAYVDRCGWTVENQWYIDTPYGRRRRFAKTDDDKQIAAYTREACNFPIQATVADTLTRATANIIRYRKRYRLENGEPLDFKLILGIHDALMFEVKPEHVRHIVETMLPVCMCEQAVIPHIDKKLDIDIEVGLRWGEAPSTEYKPGQTVAERLVEMGVDEQVIAA